jgi:hypothetical protein
MRLLIAGLVVASTAAAGAQRSPLQPTSKPAQPTKPAVVIGCLEARPGAAGFTLTTTEAELKANVPGTSDTARSPQAIPPKPVVKTVIYTVTSPAAIDLAGHVGHTVEIVGSEPPRKKAADAPDKSGSPSPTPSPPATEIVARELRVISVRTVANTCYVHGR